MYSRVASFAAQSSSIKSSSYVWRITWRKVYVQCLRMDVARRLCPIDSLCGSVIGSSRDPHPQWRTLKMVYSAADGRRLWGFARLHSRVHSMVTDGDESWRCTAADLPLGRGLRVFRARLSVRHTALSDGILAMRLLRRIPKMLFAISILSPSRKCTTYWKHARELGQQYCRLTWNGPKWAPSTIFAVFVAYSTGPLFSTVFFQFQARACNTLAFRAVARWTTHWHWACRPALWPRARTGALTATLPVWGRRRARKGVPPPPPQRRRPAGVARRPQVRSSLRRAAHPRTAGRAADTAHGRADGTDRRATRRL